jgi:hypothetical protein
MEINPKIKSISHTDKVLWIRVSPTSESIKKINQILTKFFPHENLEYFDEELGENKLETNYEYWKNSDMKIFRENEAGYIIFTETHINIILRKESKFFSKLKEDFSSAFTFEEYKPQTTAERRRKEKEEKKSKKLASITKRI